MKKSVQEIKAGMESDFWDSYASLLVVVRHFGSLHSRTRPVKELFDSHQVPKEIGQKSHFG